MRTSSPNQYKSMSIRAKNQEFLNRELIIINVMILDVLQLVVLWDVGVMSSLGHTLNMITTGST